MKRLIRYGITIIVIAVVFDLFKLPEPKYKVNECAKDQIHNDLRKVTNVGKFIYNYCKIRDNKCNKGYSMRIKDFDRIMVPSDCKETTDE